MVTLGRMGEVAEAGHIHPAYCCRAVGTVFSCVSITGWRHISLRKGMDAGIAVLDVCLGLGIRTAAWLL